jgi:dihydroorotate dehydrogenase electron transfer subunit
LCRPVCDEHFRLTLRVRGFPDAAPGQFVQIRCGGLDANAAGGSSDEAVPRDEECFGVESVPVYGRGRPFTRRPFSIAGLHRQGNVSEIDILYRVIGPGTAWMAALRAGQRVSIIGPLGRPFTLDDDAELRIVVGGGIGLPPVMWLGHLLSQAGRSAVGVCGARSRNLLPVTIGETHVADVTANTPGAPSGGDGPEGTATVGFLHIAEFGGLPVVVSTDDGSCGLKGTVVDGLHAVLAASKAPRARTVVYACGPQQMLRAVADVAIREGVACQLCMERMMACGMGTCQSCVIRIRDESHPAGWRYRLCCTDGPVFDAAQVLW